MGKYPLQYKKKSNWCWAAVATSVGLFFKPSAGWTQCSVATQSLSFIRPALNCCASSFPPRCNTPNDLETPLIKTQSFDQWFQGMLGASDIENQINLKQPVCVLVYWHAGGAHYLAITGYSYQKNSPSTFTIYIQDPLYGPSSMLLDDFPSLYQMHGLWAATYLTVKGRTGH